MVVKSQVWILPLYASAHHLQLFSCSAHHPLFLCSSLASSCFDSDLPWNRLCLHFSLCGGSTCPSWNNLLQQTGLSLPVVLGRPVCLVLTSFKDLVPSLSACFSASFQLWKRDWERDFVIQFGDSLLPKLLLLCMQLLLQGLVPKASKNSVEVIFCKTEIEELDSRLFGLFVKM